MKNITHRQNDLTHEYDHDKKTTISQPICNPCITNLSYLDTHARTHAHYIITTYFHTNTIRRIQYEYANS